MPSPLKLRTVLIRCSRLMSEMINDTLVPFGLNYSLWQVIYLVKEHHHMTSIDLAQSLKVSKPSIAKRVHILMDMKILQQIESQDKREKKLVLTDIGQDIYSQCSTQIDLSEKALLSDLDFNDLKITIENLNQLLNTLENRHQGVMHE